MRALRWGLVAAAVALSGCNCGGHPVLTSSKPGLTVDPSALDFGPVKEADSKTLPVHVGNDGKTPLTVTAAIEPGSSSAFSVPAAPVTVQPQAVVDVVVTFSPVKAGSESGKLKLSSDDPDHPSAEVTLNGGPIGPTATFSPNPLAFAPVSQPLTSKYATVTNSGLAMLHVNAVGVATGNPDFSVVAPAGLPLALKPGESVQVEVDYARSTNAAEGRLELDSDDAMPVKYLRLIPDPPKQCADGIDNDGDSLIDFPDDPGCTDANDDDESNPPQCLDGATQPCGINVGACKMGERVCVLSSWSACDGGVGPTTELCDGIDNDCNGSSDDGISETCTVNACAGARACLKDSGVDGGLWTACLPVNATAETCNGKDDDCNGQIDDGVTQVCMVNGCPGLQVCVPGGTGTFTACSANAPAPEICNGIDDDCNGQIDDGLGTISCGTGACARTSSACVNGDAGVCTPGAPGSEVCNGLDDDCNGTIDDLGNTSCGVGACSRSVLACVSGMTQTCTPGAPSNEVCNGLDDNCNGMVDDGLGSTTCGVGACQRTQLNCVGGATQPCTPGAPSTEICNGVDDNCNGTPDEGLGSTTCGVGACQRTQPNCVGGAAQTCTPGAPASEVCNGLDDNCNGTADDGLGSTTCGVGACQRTQPNCVGGATQTCTPGAPSSEVCNGLDDNCNGTADDGLGSTTCGVGACQRTQQNCVGGATQTCTPGTPAASETCTNGIDDNCNGTIDEGCSGDGGCNVDGTYFKDGGVISYTCCFGLVSANVDRFVFSSSGAVIDPQTYSGGTLHGAATTCPSGTFDAGNVLSGTCTETYQLTGKFTGPNQWTGTLTMKFNGPDCSCYGGLDTPCTNQTFPVQANR